ncbi:MAG TPA: peptidase M12 [Blastocatellia bacterium]|nr:peptidase M12 [Blastocatellia bacterium]
MSRHWCLRWIPASNFFIVPVVLAATVVIQTTVPTRAQPFILWQTETIPRTCTEIIPVSLEAAGRDRLFWKNKTELRVRFINGSQALREQVRTYASVWNQYSGLPFVFVEGGVSEIRVSFLPDGTTWSYIGNAAQNVAQDVPTMNFGWFDEHTTGPVEFRRVILHEFGHALGLIHEHQSPAAAINWNKIAVYQYYFDHFGWSHNKVNENIFKKYATALTQFTTYDPTSIMHYPIPPEFTNDNSHVDWNSSLSAQDKQFVRHIYP